MSAYHRILWIHNRIIEQKYPNAAKIAEQFEISNRQAQRDVEYMRDSLNAPLGYSPKQKGYFYSCAFALPTFFLSDSDMNILNQINGHYMLLSGYGYENFRKGSELLTKMTSDSKQPKAGNRLEPYRVEIEITGERNYFPALEYFKCNKLDDNIYAYAFYEPEIFLSILISSGLNFRILRPKWLISRLQSRLEAILQAHKL
jgi:predicted DNA-binding transcriptional regulator YafY